MAIRNDLSIDWKSSPRIITVAAPSTELTMQDLLDTCRFFEDSGVGINYDYLIDASGKEPLGGGVYVGITLRLNNAVVAFEARSGPDWVLCVLSGGNLTAIDADGNDIDPRYPTAYTTIDRASSSSATQLEQIDIRFGSFSGGVWVDAGSSYSGTDYPIGTARQPVNNMSDALEIAQYYGFTAFYILGDITLDNSLDFTQYSFVGESPNKTAITVEPDAIVTKCEFYECALTGTLDGNCKVRNSIVGNLNYITGYIESCVLKGIIQLDGGAAAYFLDCWAEGEDLADPATIDLGGSGQTLVMQNFNGRIKLKNKNGSEQISISLNAGWIELDSTITNGAISIIGTGEVIDNSTGATVDASRLVNPAKIADAVLDEAVIDHISTDSLGEFIAFIRNVEGGRWIRDGSQMIFYAPDNVTEIAKFDLKKSDGTAAGESDAVFERVRV